MSETSAARGLEINRVHSLMQGVIGTAVFDGLRCRGVLIAALPGEPGRPIGVLDMVRRGLRDDQHGSLVPGGLGLRSGERLYSRRVRDERLEPDMGGREATLALRALDAAAKGLPYPIEALWYAYVPGRTPTSTGYRSQSNIHVQVACTAEERGRYSILEGLQGRTVEDGLARGVVRLGNRPGEGYGLTIGFGTLAEARAQLESQGINTIPQPIPHMGQVS